VPGRLPLVSYDGPAVPATTPDDELLSEPHVLERVFESPIGSVPGAVLPHLRITENIVRGRDLAHATGQSATLPDDLAKDEPAYPRSQLTADLAHSGRFGPAQTDPDDAPAIDRLAAFLGRPIETSSGRRSVPDSRDRPKHVGVANKRFAALVDELTAHAGVTAPDESDRRGSGSSALKFNGSPFAMLTRGGSS
jgi:hypothetical protein